MSEKIPLLVLNSLSPAHQAQVAAVYDVTYLPVPAPAEREALIAAQGGRLRAVLTIGSIGLTAAEIAAMPKLELVCCMGVGYEGVALEAARARGIVLANGAGTNDDCVADHAFGLLIGAMRHIRKLDRLCREGVRRETIPHPPNVSGKRLGIAGLGTIGQKIARRAAGFDMAIGYHNRKPREGVSHRYFDSVLALAEWADILMVATPGGAGTRHLVNAAVLDALGPQGFLVNISRGSVVDEKALIEALQQKRIGGAGLDVFEDEPNVPLAFFELDNVVLLPHLASNTNETREAMAGRVEENLAAALAGQPMVSAAA
jgi:lactate dehydrogenase-like 2-hydroxyacid dehydrogenase